MTKPSVEKDHNETRTTPSTVIATRQADLWEERHQEKLAEIKRLDKNIDLLMVGDSITHWWEIAELNYVSLWQDYYSDYSSFNIGFSGDKTENVLWRLQNGEVENLSPRVTVLLIGANNVTIGDTAEDILMGIESIIKELQNRLPLTAVLVLSVFPRTDKPSFHDKSLQVNALLQRRLAHRQGVHYLDVNSIFYEAAVSEDKQGVDKEVKQGMLSDGLHLSFEGYRAWAEAMKPSIVRLRAGGQP